MERLVRYEFLGSWFLFWLLFVLGITIPFAVIYFSEKIVRIEYEMEDVDKFLDKWKAEH